MGVHNLWKLLAPFAEPTSPEDWRGKSVAIDASVWIEQFRATAGKTASPAEVQEKITEGFLRRMLKLLFYGIKPVVVFDGPTPALKRRELMRRRQVREENADAALRAKARQLLIRSLTSGTIIKQASEDLDNGRDAESDHDGDSRGEVAGATPALDGEVAAPSEVPVTVSAAEARDLVRRASEMLSHHETKTNATATTSGSSSTLLHRGTSSNRAHRGNASDARFNEDDDDDDEDQTPPRALQPRGYAAKMAAFASPHDRHRRDQADSHDDESDGDADVARVGLSFGNGNSASSPNGSSSAHGAAAAPPPAATPQQQSASTARLQGALSSGSFFDFFSSTDLQNRPAGMPHTSSGAIAESVALGGGASIANDLRSSSNLQGRLSGELSAPSSSALQGSLAMAYEDERQKRAREDDALLSASRRGRRSENISAPVHQHHSTSTSGTLPEQQLSSTLEDQQQHDVSVADHESSEHLNRLAAMASHQSSGVEAALSSTASAQLGRFTRQMERFTASREALEQRAKANMVRSGHVYLGPRSALGLDGGVALPAAPHAPQRNPAAPQPQPHAATPAAEGANTTTSVQHGAQHVITSTTDETFGRVEDHVFAALEAAELVDAALASDRRQDPAASLPQALPHASPCSLDSSGTGGERLKSSSAAATAATLPTLKSGGRVTVAELARLFEESVVAAAAARDASRSTDLSSDEFLDVDEESEDTDADDDDSTTSTDSSSEVMNSSPDSSQEIIQEDGTSATLPDEFPVHVKEERIGHDDHAENHKEDDDEGVFNGETDDFDDGNDEINDEEEEEEEKEESHVANDDPEASNATVVFLDVESSPSQSPSRHHRSAEEIAMELESSDDVFPVSSSALFLGGVRPLSVRLSTEAKVSEFAEQVRRENTAALASQKSPTTPIEQFVGSSLLSQEQQRQQRLTQKSDTEEVTIEDEWCNALAATTAQTTPANAGASTSARATRAAASAGRAHRAVMHSRQVVECISDDDDDDDDDEVVMIEESGSVLCVDSARSARRVPSSRIARRALASAAASTPVVAREDTLLVIDSDSDNGNENYNGNAISSVAAVKSDATELVAEAAPTPTRDHDPPVAVKSEPAPPTLVPVAVKNEPAETTSVDQRQTPSSLGSSAAVQLVRSAQVKKKNAHRPLYTGRAESAVLPVAQSPPIPTEAAGLVQLLNAFNVPWVVAASEADAQCGHLCETGLVSCVLTEDSDAFLFGASAVVRDFFSSQAANATLYRSNEIADAGLSRDVLIALAQLLGSDYAPGLPSVGAVVAVEIAAAFRATSSAPLAANNVGQTPHDELNNNSRNDKRSFAIDAVRLLSRCKRHTLHRARSIASLSEPSTGAAHTHQGQSQMEQPPQEPGDVRSVGNGEGSDNDSDDEDRTALDVVKQRIVTDRLHSRGYDQPSAWPAAFPSTTIVEGYVAPTVTDVSWMRDVLIAFGERPRCDVCVNPGAKSGNEDEALADQKALRAPVAQPQLAQYPAPPPGAVPVPVPGPRVAGPDWGQVRDIAAVSCGWNSAAIAARVDAVVAEWALRTGSAPPPATTQTSTVVFGAGAQPGLGSGAAAASSAGAGAKHASAGASKLSVGQTTLDSFRDKLFVGKQDDENKNRSDPDDPHFRADDRDGFDAWVARRMTALPPRRVPSAHIASANAAAAAAKSEARREKARQKKKAETEAMKDADARASFSFEALLPRKKSGKRERDEDSDDADDADVADRSADLRTGRESDGQANTTAAASPSAPLAVAAPQRQTSSGTWCGIGLFTAGAIPRTVTDHVPEATVTDSAAEPRHRAPVGLDDGSAVAAVQEPDSD